MVDSASVGEFKEGMGLIHLLQICLQEPSCYNASEHAESGFGRVVVGVRSVRKDSMDSRTVVDLRMWSLRGDPHAPRRRKFQHILDRWRAAILPVSQRSSWSEFTGNGTKEAVVYNAYTIWYNLVAR